MATHSSVLAWRIPGTGKPGGLRSMGSSGGQGSIPLERTPLLQWGKWFHTPAWRIPWTEEPGRLQSMVSFPFPLGPTHQEFRPLYLYKLPG